MKKSLFFFLSAIVLLLPLKYSYGQKTFSLLPGDTAYVDGYLGVSNTLQIFFWPDTKAPIIIKFQKVYEDIPARWAKGMSVGYECMPLPGPLADSGETMAFGASMNYTYWRMKVLMWATYDNQYYKGTGVVRYAVWDKANPDYKDTITFIADVYKNFVFNHTGINKTSGKNEFKISPNPVSNSLNIVSDNLNPGYEAEIITMEGITVLKSTDQDHIDVSSLASGIYFIKISDGETSGIQKFIKQ